jgi:hypothetical protein
MRPFATEIDSRNELNDLGAHENPSHSAIATSPANVSAIRYAVMLVCLVEQVVMAGPVPAILVFSSLLHRQDVDARHQAGHDEKRHSVT